MELAQHDFGFVYVLTNEPIPGMVKVGEPMINSLKIDQSRFLLEQQGFRHHSK